MGLPRLCAQIDPEHRELFQLGYNQPLEGRGPIAGYAYYYHNEPGFIRTNLTLLNTLTLTNRPAIQPSTMPKG